MHESEFKIEWLYSNLRWLYLVAVTAILSLQIITSDPRVVFAPPVIALLITGIVGNLLVMLLLMLHAFHKPLITFTLILDVSLTLGLIGTTGGVESPLLFFSSIPIITTSLRHPWWVSLSAALGTVAVYGWSASQQIEPLPGASFGTLWNDYSMLLSRGAVLLFSGLTISYIGSKIKTELWEERHTHDKQAHSQIEAAHQRIRLIFELASTLSATLNHERVLQAALDISQTGLRELLDRDISQVQLVLLFRTDQALHIANSRGISRYDKQKRFQAKEGILATVLENAEITITAEPGSDPELNQIVAMHHCREVIVAPLRAGFESYGLLVMGSPESNTYTPDYQDLLEAICSQAVMALQNSQLYQNLMEEKERLVIVEEEARKKLARDLHDGPTQTISAIAMRLNYVQMLLTRGDFEQIEVELQELETQARTTTKVIRQMLFTLRPLILESQGLVPALKQYIKKLAETNPLPIHLEAEKEIDQYLTEQAQGSLFYIIDEAITNARKHAQANDLWVRLYRQGTMNVIVEIEDNGRGFDVIATEDSYDERGSLGMLNLRERAKLSGGKTVIQSELGKGTLIQITVPTKNDLAF
ncbi:MAG TPA: sensor histidine kinase [Thermoflexia bacterium]|nr:sensor histidine kinase [Thermoflexia bacterium]